MGHIELNNLNMFLNDKLSATTVVPVKNYLINQNSVRRKLNIAVQKIFIDFRHRNRCRYTLFSEVNESMISGSEK
jgi:hypothetical protein